MTALPATSQDTIYITGFDSSPNLEHEMGALRRIYRVEEALRETGRKRFRSAIKAAYAKTQNAMESDPRVKSRFDDGFITRMRDWDAVARIYLARQGARNTPDWKLAVERFLRTRGYGDDSITEHCRALEEHGRFVETNSFLYRSRTPAPLARGGDRNAIAKSGGHSPSP
jgi:hypothetical protein